LADKINTSPLRVAVVGVGAFGRNHARVYRDLQQADECELVGIVDADATRAQQTATEFGTRAFASIEELLKAGKLDAANVAVPTIHHLSAARALMQAGADVLIEKPLANSMAEADEIATLAKKHDRIVQVGHLERFNPAVRATAPLVNKPMFFEVHRLSIFTPRSLDVDVVLDLMIHDIDIVLSFARSPLKEIRAVGIPILTHKVDIANVRLEFESGCVANLTASRVSTERVRKLRFFQFHQYISVDYGRQDVLVFSVDEKLAKAAAAGKLPELALSQPGATANPGISVQKPEIIAEEPLRAELRAFLHSVRTRTTPVVSLQDGSRALAVALEILESIRIHGQKLGL
jgi:predicted dehydrogenase